MFSNTGAYENHDQTTRAKPLRQAEVGFELGYSHHMNQHNCEPNHEDCLRNRAWRSRTYTGKLEGDDAARLFAINLDRELETLEDADAASAEQ